MKRFGESSSNIVCIDFWGRVQGWDFVRAEQRERTRNGSSGQNLTCELLVYSEVLHLYDNYP